MADQQNDRGSQEGLGPQGAAGAGDTSAPQASGAQNAAAQTPETQASDPQASQTRGPGGYEGAPPEYGRGYGRDFGGGGRNQGFDGSWGQGYGGSLGASDYRETSGGEAYGGGTSGADYARSFGGRGGDFDPDDRSWLDRCADDEHTEGRRHHRGRGPKSWTRGDGLIYEAVCERLLHDRLLDASGIEVDVEGGVVNLRGEVRGASDPALARRLAGDVSGVVSVQTELTVNPNMPTPLPPARSDDDGRTDHSPMGYPILPM